VADQHVAARERKLGAILLEASQNGKIALIHQLAAEARDVARASLLLLNARSGGRWRELLLGAISERIDQEGKGRRGLPATRVIEVVA